MKLAPSLHDGTQVELLVKVGPIWKKWVSEHRDYEEGRGFTDVQILGPFPKWVHRHEMLDGQSGQSIISDEITYRLPFGFFGEYFANGLVTKRLNRMFNYRHSQLKDDLSTLIRYPQKKIRVLVSGASGLLGNALTSFLTTGGHEVVRLVRRKAGENEIEWNPYQKTVDNSLLEGFDAVIHLSGENVAAKKWTPEFKQKIQDSRIKTTEFLSNVLSKLNARPSVFVVASAVGFFGDRGNELLKEESPVGNGFFAETCSKWEAASTSAKEAGIRTVNLRFGTILSPAGGALKKLKLPASLGVLGPIGNGETYFPWIGLDDTVGAIYHAIQTNALEGAVNCVAPELVTNKTFTRTLTKVLRRPTFFSIPEFVIKLLFGEMGMSTLLMGQRVEPAWLKATAYQFRHPKLEDCLRHALGVAKK